MEDYSGLFVLITILIIVYAVVTFLLPFFVLRIRNEIISMNRKMAQLINILGGEALETLEDQSFDGYTHKKYKCRLCSKSYGSKENLRLHLKTSHNLENSEIDENIEEV